jgi:hypothetical protein
VGATLGCGGGGAGGGTATSPTGATGGADGLVLDFFSTIRSSTAIGRFVVSTESVVSAQIPLSPGGQAGRYGASTGELRYTQFSYEVSSGGCTFSTSTTSGTLTVVEASMPASDVAAARVLLRPSSSIRESIVQSCSSTSPITIPGVYWWGGWQSLYGSQWSPAEEAWVVTGFAAASGDELASRLYERSADYRVDGQKIEYSETTRVVLRRR